jgi:hypothetical protein
MSDLLREFLSEWLAWAESGGLERQPFTRFSGLCLNFWEWLEDRDASFKEITGEMSALEGLFISEGLDHITPFGASVKYSDEGDRASMHLNPQRLAWVRSKVAQHEAA